MSDHIRTISLLVLGWLLPACGRRRAAAGAPDERPPRALPSVPPVRRFRRPAETPLRGEDSCLVRPYLLTDEEWRERRARRGRRDLWLATHGVAVR
ncbi:hypothetical protein ACIRPT_11950 [Streptomyces sp. NPDC101227]|uniref:hypothetical protein n=1 Tax=Streptomyces sp. NPDC101227 TaxID=3366136 RepID=UPI00381E7DAD